jgi:cob(I)alamin adenosyltransferase
MKKIDPDLYNRLSLQAEEARDQGMIKLAEAIEESLTIDAVNSIHYSYSDLKNEIHKDLWKIATKLMVYYDAKDIDALAVDKTIVNWLSKTIDEVEKELGVSNKVVGPFEPKLPGEK